MVLFEQWLAIMKCLKLECITLFHLSSKTFNFLFNLIIEKNKVIRLVDVVVWAFSTKVSIKSVSLFQVHSSCNHCEQQLK